MHIQYIPAETQINATYILRQRQHSKAFITYFQSSHDNNNQDSRECRAFATLPAAHVK